MNFIEKHNSENTDSKLIFTVSKKKERILWEINRKATAFWFDWYTANKIWYISGWVYVESRTLGACGGNPSGKGGAFKAPIPEFNSLSPLHIFLKIHTMIIYTSSAPNLVKQIRKLRKKYKITQANFANLLGVWTATIARWERGENTPGIDVLLNAMKVLTNYLQEDLTISVKFKDSPIE